jgi:predicted nucleic acid-binding protein
VTRLHFADTTVLINFALIDRLDLLARLVGSNGRWTATVASEWETSAEWAGFDDRGVLATILGSPIAPQSADELMLTQTIRERLRVPGDPDYRHLGESETLAIIASRGLDAHLCTDDTGARRQARQMSIDTVSTALLLVLAAKAGFVDPQECWDHFTELAGFGRFLPDAPENYGALLARLGRIA